MRVDVGWPVGWLNTRLARRLLWRSLDDRNLVFWCEFVNLRPLTAHTPYSIYRYALLCAQDGNSQLCSLRSLKSGGQEEGQYIGW